MAVMGFARDEWGRSAARKRVRVAALVALLAVLAALGVPTSAEAEISPPDCPEQQILDQAEVEALTPGTQLVGLTVEAGDAPTSIDFVVETVQRGLLGANAPLVIVRATSGSPATKGIWFGMSGSPVYTIDDRGDPEALVGAVAFGLAFGSSPLAGLQPGYAMETVRGYAPASVTVSAAVASRLARQAAGSEAMVLGMISAEGFAFVALTLVGLMLINAQAVTSITSERDGQTLELLLVTDVTAK
jgi:hypothetical protein